MNPIQLNATTIEGFSERFLVDHYYERVATPNCHREWWDMVASSHKYVALAAPRKHAKSTALNHCYGLAASLFQVHPYQLKVGKTYDLACEKLDQAKTELTENERIRSVFKFKRFIYQRENDFVAEMKDGYQFRMTAIGMNQAVRGKSFGTIRPTLIQCHTKGTWIWDDAFRVWMVVEDHPTAKEYDAECFVVSVAGVLGTETVSVDHRYWVKENVGSEPGWVFAHELQEGFFIGEERKESSVQCSVSSTAQGRNLSASTRVVAKQCGKRKSIAQAILCTQQGINSFIHSTVSRIESWLESRTHAKTQNALQASYACVGGFESYPQNISRSERTWDDGRSYRSTQVESGLRSALRSKFETHHSFGELPQVEQTIAAHVMGGFFWRPIVSVQKGERQKVVAIRTKSGFYKTKFGMSHNCDDM